MKLNDECIARIVQIIQECMMTGVDATDMIRDIDMSPTMEDKHMLRLSNKYRKYLDELAKERA